MTEDQLEQETLGWLAEVSEGLGRSAACAAACYRQDGKAHGNVHFHKRSHTEAVGGQLDVIARFPDGSVKISNFADLESDVPQQA